MGYMHEVYQYYLLYSFPAVGNAYMCGGSHTLMEGLKKILFSILNLYQVPEL